MIIDVHTHIVAEEWLPESWWRSQADFLLQTAGPFGFHSYDDIRRKRFYRFWDPEAEKLVAAMDEAGIRQSVILPLDFGLALGEALSMVLITKSVMMSLPRAAWSFRHRARWSWRSDLLIEEHLVVMGGVNVTTFPDDY